MTRGGLEHLWAGWRHDYVVDATALERGDGGESSEGGCVFCRLAESGPPSVDNGVVWRGKATFVVQNAYPYASGHLLVVPHHHRSHLEELGNVESDELWLATRASAAAITAAYAPDGLNVGANLGRAAGAGIPAHLHVHVLPRWSGDTNFMTSVAGTRVLPESLDVAWGKLHAAWSID